MLYSILADLVLLLHFAFILFAVVGGMLVLHWRWLVWLHIPTVFWASMINIAHWPCPLTPLETALRHRAGEIAYQGGFIDHYVGPVVYPGGMSRETVIIISVGVFAWNALVYAYIVYTTRKRQSSKQAHGNHV
jgi:hypothetical protein